MSSRAQTPISALHLPLSSSLSSFRGGPQSPNGSPPLSSSRSFRAHKKAADIRMEEIRKSIQRAGELAPRTVSRFDHERDEELISEFLSRSEREDDFLRERITEQESVFRKRAQERESNAFERFQREEHEKSLRYSVESLGSQFHRSRVHANTLEDDMKSIEERDFVSNLAATAPELSHLLGIPLPPSSPRIEILASSSPSSRTATPIPRSAPSSASSNRIRSRPHSVQDGRSTLRFAEIDSPDANENTNPLLTKVDGSPLSSSRRQTSPSILSEPSRRDSDVFSSLAAMERKEMRKREKRNDQKLLSKVESTLDSVDDSRSHIRHKLRESQNLARMSNERLEKYKWSEELKKKSRASMVKYMQALTVEDVRIEAEKEVERLSAEYEKRMENLIEERAEFKVQSEELREQVQELTRQKDSLQHTVGMLRHKIAKVGERQIENERRLKIYANLEPVFEELTSVFKFDSAEDIINRLNQLENTNREQFAELQEMRMEKMEMDKKLEDMRASKNNLENSLYVEHQKERQMLERRIIDLRRSTETMEASLRSYSDTERKYLEVSGLISNLYHKYAELALNQVDTPNFSDPFSVLEAIQELVIRFVPNKAGAAFRELGGFANRLWSKYFTDDEELRGQHREILDRFEHLFLRRCADIEKVQSELQEKESDLRSTKEEVERKRRDINKLVTQVEALKALKLHTLGVGSGSRQIPQRKKRPQSSSSVKSSISRTGYQRTPSPRPQTALSEISSVFLTETN